MAVMVQINGEKLSQIIKDRGLKKSHVSTELGFNSCFINKCIYRNEMSQAAARMLEVLFGIQFDDYKYTEPEPVEIPPIPVLEQMGEHRGAGRREARYRPSGDAGYGRATEGRHVGHG